METGAKTTGSLKSEERLSDFKERCAQLCVKQLDGDTDDCNRPTRPVKADSKVVKTLGTVLCSSRDGVPLKLKKENGRPGNLKLSIE